MKKVLLTGATGMVGSQVLQVLLENQEVKEVLSLGRRKTGLEYPKLTEIIHDNFLDFSTLENQLKGLDLCIYCLATYQNQVSKEQYIQITCDFQKALTDFLEPSNPDMTFVLFGATGADPTEKSRLSFARIKGRAEVLLHGSSFPPKIYFSAGIYSSSRGYQAPGIMAQVSRSIGGFLMRVFPANGITNRELAEVMVKVGLKYPEDSKVFENREIRALLDRDP